MKIRTTEDLYLAFERIGELIEKLKNKVENGDNDLSVEEVALLEAVVENRRMEFDEDARFAHLN